MTYFFTTLSSPDFVLSLTTSFSVSHVFRTPLVVQGNGDSFGCCVAHDVGVRDTFACSEKRGGGRHDPKNFSRPSHRGGFFCWAKVRMNALLDSDLKEITGISVLSFRDGLLRIGAKGSLRGSYPSPVPSQVFTVCAAFSFLFRLLIQCSL